jgi:HD-GYP domain-containing protein (c-di-GMP phosphodiesterase class II)
LFNLLPYLSLQVIGVLVALVTDTAPVLLPLLLIPAATTYLAFEMISRLRSQTQEAMIAMADAIDQRDPYTAGHSLRVADLAVRIGEVHGLNERDIQRLRIAARLHDLGKIGIGNEILHKAGKLTDAEWTLMRAHPLIGEQLLKPYRQFRHEVRLIRSHHERWDGRGYPDSLSGEQIPLGARIIAIADTFDAMTTARPYRPALSHEVTIEEIRTGTQTQFDPALVVSFQQVIEEWRAVRPVTHDDHQRGGARAYRQAPEWFFSLS